MPAEVYNANPTLYAPSSKPTRKDSKRSIWFGDDEDDDSDSDQVELIDRDEVFGEHNFGVSFHFLTVNVNYCPADLIRSIYDPEHPNSLEELRVVSAPQVEVGENRVMVEFTPTVPHCGMSTLIGLQKITFVPLTHPHTVFVPGLSIRVRLLRSLPERYKVDIRVKPGSHQSEVACAYDL